MSSAKGQDAKFFTRGKIQELRAELQAADSKDKKGIKRKVALKKVVANITMGNDMSSLFTDVVQCLSSNLVEIKKMVYLFLISYGRTKQDQLPMVIPRLLQDCNDRDPLVRALAIRTMAYIPVPIVTEALTDQLRHCLRDKDPYVRKTAAIAVAKVYTADPRRAERERFVEMLRDLLMDENATVVSNAVAALSEIGDRPDGVLFKINLTLAHKLVAAVGESSEWGQIYILDCLLRYVPERHIDAEQLAERILAQLSHANAAVVLTTVKVLLYLMNYMEDRSLVERVCKKMGPPLVALLSSGPEVQYVTLRNILLIIQRRPAVLKNDVKVFFCKYNDPAYVKMAKLEIMYRLAREENAPAVLAELQEYATEVDIDFVRKAVRSIGRLAIKVEPAADECIRALLELVENNVNYVVQEAVIVIKDVFRRYPGKYEGIIPTLCEHMDALDEPEAKAAMVWILGQFAQRIDNAEELMDDLTYTFLDETTEVQLALLSASVKLFIYKPTSESAKTLVYKVLKWATEEVDNPDLRDRGFMYWRMLAINPTVASEIVLAEKPAITTDSDRMDRGALDQLLLHTGTIASIYHKNPETFIRGVPGKQLAISPALNPNSRAVLMTVSTSTRLPPTRIIVPGGGPTELRESREAGNLQADRSKPTPTTPVTPTSAAVLDVADDEPDEDDENGRGGGGDDDDEDEQARVGIRTGATLDVDPYANLDGAFGGGASAPARTTNGRAAQQDDSLI